MLLRSRLSLVAAIGINGNPALAQDPKPRPGASGVYGVERCRERFPLPAIKSAYLKNP